MPRDIKATALLILALAAATSAAAATATATCGATVENKTGYGGANIYSIANVSSFADCCAACAPPLCVAWTFLGDQPDPATGLATCELRSAPPTKQHTSHCGSKCPRKTSGTFHATPAPTPPPAPRPTPAPVPAGTQRNIIFITSDDQDLVLGSMQALPQTGRLLRDGGANLTNFFAHTPICCPSRTTMLSGRYQHNNRMDNNAGPPEGCSKTSLKCCMRQNVSRADNPGFWDGSFVRRLHDDHGYLTGLFGKVLNEMGTYGCDGASGLPPGVDRQYVMCTHTFFDCDWVDQTTLRHTGDDARAPAGGAPYVSNYTTSVMGNKSVAWIENVLAMGPNHPPFFAWIGPHAPHLPATPAPWYEDHPIGLNTAPREDPYYNYSGRDKHAFIATEPILTAADAKGIDIEYAKRLRSLLSVDDIMEGLAAVLQAHNEWDNTFVIYTSDHGYSLGQFRIPSHKMQVYDHGVRVPALVRGPGIAPGSELAALSTMADVAPTILELAAGADAVPASMDGRSLAPLLLGAASAGGGASPAWRDAVLIEYESISDLHDGKGPQKHQCDSVNNTFRALRIMNASHDMMYAEFTDVSVAKDWNFPLAGLNFFELYNVSEDVFMLHNQYATADPALKDALHAQLAAAYRCKGQVECP